MKSACAGLSSLMMNGSRSMYTDRVALSQITNNPSLGEEKPVFYSIRACMSLIKTEQTMYYRACNYCKKKVIDVMGSGYRCDSCQKSENDCNLRYILSAKFSDATGGAWFSVFSDEATKIIGCSADELDNMKSQNDGIDYQTQHVFRVVVAPREYNNEKKQRITVKSVAPLDFAAESKFLLEEISSKKA